MLLGRIAVARLLRVMHVEVMAEMGGTRSRFVRAQRRRRTPGELERQDQQQSDGDVAAHGGEYRGDPLASRRVGASRMEDMGRESITEPGAPRQSNGRSRATLRARLTLHRLQGFQWTHEHLRIAISVAELLQWDSVLRPCRRVSRGKPRSDARRPGCEHRHCVADSDDGLPHRRGRDPARA